MIPAYFEADLKPSKKISAYTSKKISAYFEEDLKPSKKLSAFEDDLS
jgi:hypothetical protein